MVFEVNHRVKKLSEKKHKRDVYTCTKFRNSDLLYTHMKYTYYILLCGYLYRLHLLYWFAVSTTFVAFITADGLCLSH
jgi:hypothetical protein